MKNSVIFAIMAIIVSGIWSAKAEAAGAQCAKGTIVRVFQGWPWWKDSRYVGIKINPGNGNAPIYLYTRNSTEVGNNPEARTLLQMALAAWAAGVTVIASTRADCTSFTVNTVPWIDAWNGLEIVSPTD